MRQLSEMRTWWSVVMFFLAWIPLFLLWTLFVLTYGGGALPVGVALREAVRSVGTAAVLGLGIWWFTGYRPWPERVRVPFYLLHLLAGSVYAATWQGIGVATMAISTGRPLSAVAGEQWNLIGWRGLTGLCLYGLVAGASYAVRIRARLREQTLLTIRATALAAQARLQALQAQLNPHFLFNALHSVSALIRRDPDAAERAVERLGGLLRYALDGGEEGGVRLEEEWAFTRDYLELEQLRFDDRLRVEAHFDPGTLCRKVPVFSLQPLVENAVRHGIAARPDGGSISIDARLVGPDLIVSVKDDGAGMDGSAEAGGGHGLTGLRQRLTTIYGSEAALRIESVPGSGFAATMTLPA